MYGSRPAGKCEGAAYEPRYRLSWPVMSNHGALPDPFIGLVGIVDVGRQYSDAPIIEATVDLRVSLPGTVDLDDLSALYPDLDPPHGRSMSLSHELKMAESQPRAINRSGSYTGRMSSLR